MKGPSSPMRENRWLILIILLGLILRLIDIARPFSGLSGWNEGHYSLAPLNYFKYGVFTPMNDYGLDLSTTPILYWAIYVSFKFFGVYEWSARVPSLISGIISIWLIFLIAEKLYDREVAHLGAFIAAVSPGIVYFSRSVQLESTMAMFSLASLLSLLHYGDFQQRKWYWASMLFLTLAILVKNPAVLIYPVLIWIWFEFVGSDFNKPNLSRLSTYLFFPLIPSLLWIYYGVSSTPLFIKGYFFRPAETVSGATIFDALSKAVFQFVPWNLGSLQFYLLIAGIPILLISWKRHMPMLLLSITWLALVIKYPKTYLNNWYYDYLALYGMSVLAGFIIVEIWNFYRQSLEGKNFTKVVASILMIVLLFNLNGYYDPFHKYFDDTERDFNKIGESEPFYSAKYVAKENVEKNPVLVTWPSTMFYAGADPEYVKAFHFNDEGVVEAINQRKFAYVVLYYSLNQEILNVLKDGGYEKIAPRAWKRDETNKD